MQPTLIIGIGGTGASVIAGVRRKMLNAPALNLPVQLCQIENCINNDPMYIARELGISLGEIIPLDGFNIVDFVKHACMEDSLFQQWWDCSARDYDLYPLATQRHESHAFLHWIQKMGRRDRRLMLYYHYQKVKTILHKSIAAVLSYCDENTAPLVMISASTCGGMSGVILDVAYLVRNIFSMIGRSANILGVFALANVFPDALMYAPEQSRRMVLNTVATLKEITHYATTKYAFGPPGQVITFDSIEPVDGYWLTDQIQSIGQNLPMDYFSGAADEINEAVSSGNWTVACKSKYVPAPLDTKEIADWAEWEGIYDNPPKIIPWSVQHISRELDHQE